MNLKVGFLAVAATLQAQPSMAAATIGPQATKPVARSTMFSPVPRSMQQLIEDGFQVVNIAIGLSGFGYLLKQDTRYVTCAVQPDNAHPGMFLSECRAMN